jgi:hypothetical protein
VKIAIMATDGVGGTTFSARENAGTSIDQIERFYARNLPLSVETAVNLQSFGDSDLS